MAKKVINVGTTANDDTGDSLRVAGVKINDNFTELYNVLGGESGAPLSIVSKILAGDGIAISAETGNVLVTNKVATSNQLGGIKAGTGITIDETGVASVEVYQLPKASQTILGGIKVGDRLSIDANGVLSADAGAYTLPKATPSVLGGIKIGAGLVIDPGGIVSVNAFDQTLNTTDVPEFAGIVSRVYTTEGASSIFHRNNQSVVDTGLNIRGSIDKSPIYIYNYGSDGNGLGGSEIDVKELSVDIYTKWGSVEQRKWQFTNLTNEGNALITPTVILGSTGTEDQLISIDSTHSNTVGNTDLNAYVRIFGPDDPDEDNQGVTNAPRANKIRIASNTLADYVEGVGYTGKGRIELIAGGLQSDTYASIEMGQLGDMSHAFPPTGEPVVTTTSHISLVGGAVFYGDVTLAGGSTLAIRNQIVFQDGTIQTTAYTGGAGGIPDAIAAGSYQLVIDTSGNLTYPYGIVQSSQDNTSCPAGADTVVYTSTDQYQHAIKLFVIVEGYTDGGGESWDTQACDVIAVKGYNNDIVHVTTYGVTYSGASAIATFDGQWNPTSSRIEITCTPTSTTNSVKVSVHAIEMASND